MNKIIIFGVGAIGSNLVAGLVDEIDAEFYVVDGDFVDKHELPLLPWNDKMFFMWRKVKAVNYWLYNKTKRQCQTLDKHLNKSEDIKRLVDNFIDQQDRYIILECFDNSESRELFKDLDYPILHIGIKPNRVLFCKWKTDFDYVENNFDQDSLLRESDAKILVDKLVQVSIDIIKRYFTEQAALPQINTDI